MKITFELQTQSLRVYEAIQTSKHFFVESSIASLAKSNLILFFTFSIFLAGSILRQGFGGQVAAYSPARHSFSDGWAMTIRETITC